MDRLGQARRRETGVDDTRSASSRQSCGLHGLLSAAIACTKGLGDGYASLASQLDGPRSRLARGRFHLAVLGQFKRGKLDALPGEAVLATAVVPLAAISTFIRPGETLAAHVYFQDRREIREAQAQSAEERGNFLAGFVIETRNPKNNSGVAQGAKARRQRADELAEAGKSALVPMALLAVLCLALGVLPTYVIPTISRAVAPAGLPPRSGRPGFAARLRGLASRPGFAAWLRGSASWPGFAARLRARRALAEPQAISRSRDIDSVMEAAQNAPKAKAAG